MNPSPRPGLLHENVVDYSCSLIADILIFMIKSIYFFAEMVFLTMLPNRLRKVKVSKYEFNLSNTSFEKWRI